VLVVREALVVLDDGGDELEEEVLVGRTPQLGLVATLAVVVLEELEDTQVPLDQTEDGDAEPASWRVPAVAVGPVAVELDDADHGDLDSPATRQRKLLVTPIVDASSAFALP